MISCKSRFRTIMKNESWKFSRVYFSCCMYALCAHKNRHDSGLWDPKTTFMLETF